MPGLFMDVQILSRCGNSSRRCGAKRVSKSNVLKPAGFEAILRCEVTNLANFSHSTNTNNNNNNNKNKTAKKN